MHMNIWRTNSWKYFNTQNWRIAWLVKAHIAGQQNLIGGVTIWYHMAYESPTSMQSGLRRRKPRGNIMTSLQNGTKVRFVRVPLQRRIYKIRGELGGTIGSIKPWVSAFFLLHFFFKNVKFKTYIINILYNR